MVERVQARQRGLVPKASWFSWLAGEQEAPGGRWAEGRSVVRGTVEVNWVDSRVKRIFTEKTGQSLE